MAKKNENDLFKVFLLESDEKKMIFEWDSIARCPWPSWCAAHGLCARGRAAKTKTISNFVRSSSNLSIRSTHDDGGGDICRVFLLFFSDTTKGFARLFWFDRWLTVCSASNELNLVPNRNWNKLSHFSRACVLRIGRQFCLKLSADVKS